MSLTGLGDTTVTVAGQTITVDAEGNWVEPWYCWVGGLFFDPTDCTPPNAATLAAANNAANIGSSASAASVAAATSAMSQTDQSAMESDPCVGSDSPTLCSLTGGYIGGNGVAPPCLINCSGSSATGLLLILAGVAAIVIMERN